MKKWLKVLGAGALAFGLAACNTTAKPAETTDPDTGKKTEVSNVSEMTAQEVYEKAMEVSKDQKSMHTDMTIKQKISSGDETVNSNIGIKMDAVIEPVAIHQIMSMDMGADIGKMDMEMYMTDKEVYMNDPESGEWLKFPEEMSEQILAELGTETDATLDLKLFQEYVDDFQFEQTNDAYVLKLKASGEKFDKLLKEMVEEQVGMEGMQATEDMMVNEMTMEIYIDKETYYTTSFTMDMDMDMAIEGEKVHTKQKVSADISKINEVEVEIPQDVIDNAVDLAELMQQQQSGE